MLEAIISFMPSEGVGAIGALDWTAEERKKLAREVQYWHWLRFFYIIISLIYLVLELLLSIVRYRISTIARTKCSRRRIA